MPKPASKEFTKMQNQYLQLAITKKGITYIKNLIPIKKDIYVWRGDITTLSTDAVVNAANSGMLGCFHPCHGCIDNAIHTFAGIQLRERCYQIMDKQCHAEPVGQAKITQAFNLPSKYIIHTVGPVSNGNPTADECKQLASCYISCLAQAEKYNCKSIAFCCISTGEFHFPNVAAAQTAIKTINDYKIKTNSNIKVLYNVYTKIDEQIYLKLLGAD
jgi:O-acetyl-ADP-ribose deacetylase (regulator of RNase III)